MKLSQFMLSSTFVEISGGDKGDIMSSYICIYYFEMLLSLYVYITYISIKHVFVFLLVFLHRYEISVERHSDSSVATPVSVFYYFPVAEYRDPYPIIFGSSYITLCIL